MTAPTTLVGHGACMWMADSRWCQLLTACMYHAHARVGRDPEAAVLRVGRSARDGERGVRDGLMITSARTAPSLRGKFTAAR